MAVGQTDTHSHSSDTTQASAASLSIRTVLFDPPYQD